jgi:hypothetical protein
MAVIAVMRVNPRMVTTADTVTSTTSKTVELQKYNTNRIEPT